MTASLPLNGAPPGNLRLLARKPPFHQWHDALNYLESEVDFYQQLLRMGLASGSGKSKPLLYRLLNEFSEYRETALPELRAALNERIRQGEDEPNAANDFLKKLEQHDQLLRKLKHSVFAHISELQQITIW